MSKMIFVRHGQSEANANKAIARETTALTEEGLAQAKATARSIKDLGIKTIACSPLRRAVQTARAIATELGIEHEDIKIIDELRERKLGDFEGKPRDYEPEYYFLLDGEKNVEPCVNIIERTQIALEKIKKLSEAGLVLVVGHSVSGFYLAQVAAGKAAVADFDPPNNMKNADFIEVEL